MSTIRSWLPSRSPSRQRSDYELPMYRPQAAAFPPPPITASMHTTVSRPRTREVNSIQPASPPSLNDETVLLQRRERHLQHVLQDLLDAQAEGLMAGLDNGTASEHGSSDVASNALTPTESLYGYGHSSPSSPSAILNSPRARKVPGLRRARREIYRRILDCAALKEEEDNLLQRDVDADQQVLARLRTWEQKRQGLDTQIKQINTHDTVQARMEEMRGESKRLGEEISELELKLIQLKTRQRGLETQMKEMDNKRECELSSWRSSLRILDGEVENFLARPPIRSMQEPREQVHGDPQKLNGADGAQVFLSLPPRRRTLAMAVEHWERLDETSTRKRRVIRRDRKALEEGAVVWKAVVEDISSFERDLEIKMSTLSAPASPSPPSRRSSPTKAASNSEEVLESLAHDMDSVLSKIESYLATAQDKRWNLLVVCIGAEVEALRQGREMLRQSLAANVDLLEHSHMPDEALESSQKRHDRGRSRDISQASYQTAPSGAVDRSVIRLEGEGQVDGGVAVSRPPAPLARTVTSESRDGQSLMDTNPHHAALHASMYDTDEDPGPELMMGRGADTDTDVD